jgi:hypothetical protein
MISNGSLYVWNSNAFCWNDLKFKLLKDYTSIPLKLNSKIKFPLFHLNKTWKKKHMLKFEFKKWFCINCKSLMLFVQHWHLVVGWQTHWMASKEIVLKLLYLSSFLLHWWRSQMFHFEWMHFYVIQWFHLLEKNSIKQEIFFENKGYKFTILPNF